MQRKSKSNFVSRGLPWDKELWRRFLICKCKFILILLLLRILGPAGAFHVSTINYTRPGRSIWKCIFANTWEMQFREWTIRQYLAKLLTDDVGHLLLRPPAACSSWLVAIWRWWSCLHFFIVLTLLYCTLTTRDYYDSHNKRYNRKIIFCILLTSHHCCKFSVLKCLHVGEWVASCTWTAAEPQTINLFRFFSAQRRWRPLQKLHQLVRDAILQVDGGSRKAVTQLTNNNQKPARDTHIQLHCYNSIPLVHGISLLLPIRWRFFFLARLLPLFISVADTQQGACFSVRNMVVVSHNCPDLCVCRLQSHYQPHRHPFNYPLGVYSYQLLICWWRRNRTLLLGHGPHTTHCVGRQQFSNSSSVMPSDWRHSLENVWTSKSEISCTVKIAK